MKWEEAWPLIDSIGGWLNESEARTLFNLSALESSRVVVELGAYLGRSTAALALGRNSSLSHPRLNSCKITSIDLWNLGSNTHYPNNAPYPNLTRREFDLNMERLKISSLVIPIQDETAQAALKWWFPQKVDLLFIDAGHNYQNVRDDFNAWKRHLYSGSVVAFHDATAAPGVTRFLREVLNSGQLTRYFQTHDELSIVAGDLAVLVKS